MLLQATVFQANQVWECSAPRFRECRASSRREKDYAAQHASSRAPTQFKNLNNGLLPVSLTPRKDETGELECRRKLNREFKLEAARLVRQGVEVAQAARDLDPHANVLRN
jgi:hypothetical protein